MTIIEVSLPLILCTSLTPTLPQDLVTNKLDTAVFPFVVDPVRTAPSSPTTGTGPAPPVTSLRHKAVWTKPGSRPAGGPGRGSDNRQRVFVFVAGGMTYSEMRSAYELSNQLGKDVYIGELQSVQYYHVHFLQPELTTHDIGSTHTIIPEEFIGDLETLDIGGQGSSSIPSGLPESSTAQQRPFQVYYDQKYMTKDEPPPPPKPAPPAPASPSGLLGLPSRPVISALGLGRSASPSPAASFSSAGGGAASETERKEKEKLKKKRFLGF